MADYNILMHQLNASGTYDNLFPKTKGGLVEGPVANSNALGGYNYTQVINNAVAQALAGAAKIQTGSYVGTGTYGPNNPNTLTFDFAPTYLQFLTYRNPQPWWVSNASNIFYTGIFLEKANTDFTPIELGLVAYASVKGKKSGDGMQFSWYAEANSAANATSSQFNVLNQEYFWIAF